MALDPIEERLARYALPAPPPGFRDELMADVARRIVRRRRAHVVSGVSVVLLAAGAVIQVMAGCTYRQAMQLANGKSRPVPAPVMLAYAATMGVPMPDTGMPPRPDGG